MSIPVYLRAQGDVVYLQIKVQPRAPRHEIGKPLGNELKIKIAAAPVDSAANEALIDFLSERLNCPRNLIEIVRGQTSRHKILAIRGVPQDVIAEKLDPGKHD